MIPPRWAPAIRVSKEHGVRPGFSIYWRGVPPLEDPEPRERLLEGLRKSGLK